MVRDSGESEDSRTVCRLHRNGQTCRSVNAEWQVASATRQTSQREVLPDQERATRVRDETPDHCDHEKTIFTTDSDDKDGVAEYCLVCNDLRQITLDKQ